MECLDITRTVMHGALEALISKPPCACDWCGREKGVNVFILKDNDYVYLCGECGHDAVENKRGAFSS